MTSLKQKAFVVVDSHYFVIEGEPVSYPELKTTHYRTWNSHREHKLKYEITLGNQFEGKQLLSGPLALEVQFYFPSKKGNPKSHVSKPDLNRLVRFIQETCLGIVYGNEALLSYIFCSKHYDDNPRTQFSISRIK